MAGNAAISVCADVLGKSSTIVWTVLAARLLTQAEFGAFFFTLTVALLLSGVAEWGFDGVMVQRGSRHPEQLPELFTKAVAWQTAVAAPLFAVGGALVALSRPEPAVRLCLALVLLATLLDIWSDTSRAVAAALRDQGATARALVVQRATTAVLVSGSLLLGGGLVGTAAGFLAGSCIGALLHLRSIARVGVTFRRHALQRQDLLAFLFDTRLIGLTSLVLMVLFRFDAVLLGLLRGDAVVGAYAAAYRLLETTLFVAFALRSAIFPVMSASGLPAVVRASVERGVAALSLVYLPFAVVCLVDARAVLDLVYGQVYADSSTAALRWLALAPEAFAVAYLATAALQASHRFRGMLGSALAAVVVNVSLNVLLIPRYGGTAAAAATTLSYGLQAVLAVVLLRRAGVVLHLVTSTSSALVSAALLAAFLLAVPLPLVLEVALGGLLFLGSWFLCARTTRPDQLRALGALIGQRGAA